MNELVGLQVPAEFVVALVLPTAAEIGFGLREGWLSRQDAILIAVAKYNRGAQLTGPELELVLLLPQDADRVDDLIDQLEVSDEPTEQRARVWVFLTLAWVLEHRDSYDDPYEVVGMLFTDFDYPPEITRLVGFMPAPVGEPVGPSAIDKRWREYIERVSEEYRERNASMTG